LKLIEYYVVRTICSAVENYIIKKMVFTMDFFWDDLILHLQWHLYLKLCYLIGRH